MTLVLVMQQRAVVRAEKALPSDADRDYDGPNFAADGHVGIGDELLRGRCRSVQASPGEIEGGLGATSFGLDCVVEQSHTLVKSLRSLDRQRALLLENDVVKALALDVRQRDALVPVHAQGG